jgi:hypothetical protein
MASVRLCAILPVLLIPCLGQSPQEIARLGSVRTIYVDSLGSSEGAELLRYKIQNRLVGAKGIVVVTTPEQADAILKGVGEVTQGYHASVGGSATDGTGSISGRADSTQEAEVVLQLVSKTGRILWVDESQRQGGGVVSGIARVISATAQGAAAGANHQPIPNANARPARDSSEAANVVVTRLLKAIQKDRKAR